MGKVKNDKIIAQKKQEEEKDIKIANLEEQLTTAQEAIDFLIMNGGV